MHKSTTRYFRTKMRVHVKRFTRCVRTNGFPNNNLFSCFERERKRGQAENTGIIHPGNKVKLQRLFFFFFLLLEM